jgi:hypothetical protein
MTFKSSPTPLPAYRRQVLKGGEGGLKISSFVGADSVMKNCLYFEVKGLETDRSKLPESEEGVFTN